MRAASLFALMLAGTSALGAQPEDSATQAINALGVELMPLVAAAHENTLLSPYSIQLALAMTYAGAEGSTREQMAKVLHYPPDGLNASFTRLRGQLGEAVKNSARMNGGKGDPISLNVANRLFGQSGYAFHKEFLELLKQDFDAPLEQLDFKKNAGVARKTINTWVEKQTKNRIQDLLPADALTPLTTLVLVNAVYLKAPWAGRFNESATQPRPFHLSSGESIEVPTMSASRSFGYAKRDGYTAVTIPYLGGELQLLILLPDSTVRLAALEKRLNAGMLGENSTLPYKELNLELPKFHMAPPTFSLREALIKLGMPHAFDVPEGTANFEGMAPRRADDYLYISKVFHKTFVEIDEKGTEAAAATAVVMARATAMLPKEPSLEVKIDRPFLFAIQHRESGACLFLGRLTDPR